MDKITEEHSFEGRRSTVTWHDSSFLPPRNLVTQASGICFTDGGLIVLVTVDGKSWGLPGGHPENGETIEEAFIREVNEEAYSIVTSLVYLGTQEVNDPGNPQGPTYYQTRFWARVQLNEFRREYETIGRKLVNPSALISTLNWKPTTRIIEAILEAALDCEQRFNSNKQSNY
ncbi:MAG: NUDIX domain-containing protein [Chloroflexi bacterium]|nr:NUDIX domain-containing protein [Chloroflexota bacterium]